MDVVNFCYEILMMLLYIQGVAALFLTIFIWKNNRWPEPKEFVLCEQLAAFLVVGIYIIEFVIIGLHYWGVFNNI